MLQRLVFGALLSVAALPSLPVPPAMAAPRDPSGVWLTEDGRARVRLEKCGSGASRLCGFIVWLKPGTVKSTTDRNNPDPAKVQRAVLGHQLILGLRPNEDDHFEGRIYNSDDGRSYDVEVWLAGGSELKVKGCLVAFLCSTQSWTRVGDVVQGQLTGPTGGPGGPVADAEWASRTASPAGGHKAR